MVRLARDKISLPARLVLPHLPISHLYLMVTLMSTLHTCLGLCFSYGVKVTVRDVDMANVVDSRHVKVAKMPANSSCSKGEHELH